MFIPDTVMFKNMSIDDHCNYQISNCDYCGNITITKLTRIIKATDKKQEIHLCSDCLGNEVEQINIYRRDDN